MSRVFVIEPPRNGVDVSKAACFGEIQYVFDHTLRRHSVFNVEAYKQDVLHRLEELQYKPDDDYICITGALVVITMTLVALHQRHDSINVLLFSSNNDSYIAKRT